MSDNGPVDYGGDYSIDGFWPLVGKLVLAFVAVVLFSIAFFRGRELDPVVNLVFVVLGLTFGVVAALGLLSWAVETLGGRIISAYEAAWYARARTRPEIVLLERLSRMDPEQLRLVSQYVPMISCIGGSTGPIWNWDTTQGKVPLHFLRDFLDMTIHDISGREFLVPVRSWSEGSREHAYADWLTRQFIMVGLAKEAAGLHSAEWIDYNLALVWTGRARMDWLLGEGT